MGSNALLMSALLFLGVSLAVLEGQSIQSLPIPACQVLMLLLSEEKYHVFSVNLESRILHSLNVTILYYRSILLSYGPGITGNLVTEMLSVLASQCGLRQKGHHYIGYGKRIHSSVKLGG